MKMFETQDMLPRMPPVPSVPANEAITKPTVPEVSIIFGNPAPSPTPITTTESTPPSYAAWKRQNLPRVTFPPNLNDEQGFTPSISSTGSNYITTRSNVFPMRTVTIATNAPTGMHATTNLASGNANEKHLQHETAVTQIQSLPSTLSQFNYRSEQRRSMDSLSQRSQTTAEVLTICASTQTDAISQADNVACELFKNEFQQLVGVIKELQDEQRKMRQAMEAFFLQQQQTEQSRQVFCCDRATQSEPEISNGTAIRSIQLENLPPYNVDGGSTLHQALPNVKIYSSNVRDTPPPPVAQSTTYRMNTPNNAMQCNNQYANTMPALPKPTTERSMVMNELALKYLPTEKLTELLQDAQITTVGSASASRRPMPLRETDHFNRAPVDISNASYKYLRKYRLLPDQNNDSPTQKEMQSSPYQQRLQDSPIPCMNGNSGQESESPHIDLEHIRRQPKFL